MKRKKLWIWIGLSVLILVVIGFGISRILANKAPEVSAAEAKIESISATLMIPGTLKWQNEQVIYHLPELGEITEIFVKEGDQVKKGQLLAKRENQQLKMQIEQNKLQIEFNKNKLKQIDKQWDLLNKELERLAKQIGAKEAEKQLAPQYEQLRLEAEMAQLELDQALLQKDALEQQQKDLEITSVIDGTVITVNHGASSSNVQEPVIVIGSVGQMTARGYLSEYDAIKVKKDQKVILESDALPEQKWEGVVSKVGVLPEQGGLNSENRFVQYPVEVRITSGDIQLKPGFQLTMLIETEKKEALVIPLNAVKYEKNKTYVYKIEGKKARKTEVKLGISSAEKVEVLSGLKAGDKVIQKPSEKITDGLEVTVK